MKRVKVDKVVEKTFKKCKSPGDGYAGLSKRQVLKCVTSNERLRKFNVRFTNKAKPRPISVKRIQEQHQTDLVDMKSMNVEYKGNVINIFLSLMDTFLRFH